MSALTTVLPGESFIYFGDTARAPYGGRTQEALIQMNAEIIRFLKSFGIKALVMACNTSCSVVLPTLPKDPLLPVFGLIDPAVAEAVRVSRNKRVAIVATAATIRSGSYETALKALSSDCLTTGIACPDLVPMIENGDLDSDHAQKAVATYCAEMTAFSADTVIFGCSHYPYLRPLFEHYLPASTFFVNPAQTVATTVYETLGKEALLNSGSQKGIVDYWASGDTRVMKVFLSRFLGQEVEIRRTHNPPRPPGTPPRSG